MSGTVAAAFPFDDASADTEDAEDALDAADETVDNAEDDAEEEGAEDEVTEDEARRRAAIGDADKSLSSCAGSDSSRRMRLGAETGAGAGAFSPRFATSASTGESKS